MGAMTNNARKIAVLVGVYKGLQSGAAAIAWHLDGIKVPYMNIFGATWGLLAGGLVIALPLLVFRIKDHTDPEEDTLGGVDAEGHKVGEAEHPHSPSSNEK